MREEPPVPETSVLAVASHVVSGNVGNKVAVFTLQSMGCDVAALNTVQFSNHTGYRQWKGTRVSAQEITDLWDGLKQSYLDDFDMMLSGYVPGAPAVESVGAIAREMREKADRQKGPGGFFWVLDPVMGDNGKIYVADDVVPAYRSLVPHADLILPNQFEAELLSEVKITDTPSLERAIQVLHTRYGVPHVVITSVSLPMNPSQTPSLAPSRSGSPIQSQPPTTKTMTVVGSSMTSDGNGRRARLFKIHFPVFDCYFSGTGDMFAALMVTRMREAVWSGVGSGSGSKDDNSNDVTSSLKTTKSWLSPDDVDALDLPLARASEKVLASMHEVLARTCEDMSDRVREAMRRYRADREKQEQDAEIDDKVMHLFRSGAAELRLARHLGCLRDPVIEYRAERM